MKLRQYLGTPGNTVVALARRMGVSHTSISRLADGSMQPSMEMLRRLHVATDGKVAPNDFLDAPAVAETLGSQLAPDIYPAQQLAAS